MRTYYKSYPKRIEFTRWPDEIDGLPEELEKADLILITHDHKDHCKRVTVDRLARPDTLIVAPKRCVKTLGKGIKVIGQGEEITYGDIKIKVVEAYNFKQTSFPKKIWHRKGNGVGYVLTLEGKTIYHAGDTDFIPEMRELGGYRYSFNSCDYYNCYLIYCQSYVRVPLCKITAFHPLPEGRRLPGGLVKIF